MVFGNQIWKCLESQSEIRSWPSLRLHVYIASSITCPRHSDWYSSTVSDCFESRFSSWHPTRLDHYSCGHYPVKVTKAASYTSSQQTTACGIPGIFGRNIQQPSATHRGTVLQWCIGNGWLARFWVTAICTRRYLWTLSGTSTGGLYRLLPNHKYNFCGSRLGCEGKYRHCKHSQLALGPVAEHLASWGGIIFNRNR